MGLETATGAKTQTRASCGAYRARGSGGVTARATRESRSMVTRVYKRCQSERLT